MFFIKADDYRYVRKKEVRGYCSSERGSDTTVLCEAGLETKKYLFSNVCFS